MSEPHERIWVKEGYDSWGQYGHWYADSKGGGVEYVRANTIEVKEKVMTDNLVKQARESLNGVSKEPWEIEWYICQADEGDVQHAKTRKLKRGESRKDVQVGDELWRVATRIGPISPEHNHWSGTSLACNVADAMFVKTAHSLLPLMAYRIEELEAKLAKAVKALDALADCVDDGCYCSEMQMATAMDHARTTIAEMKRENND
ncbi:hypothetical protein N9Z41_02660 [bacterium]|nr:hypothetical protein [bacterium]